MKETINTKQNIKEEPVLGFLMGNSSPTQNTRYIYIFSNISHFYLIWGKMEFIYFTISFENMLSLKFRLMHAQGCVFTIKRCNRKSEKQTKNQILVLIVQKKQAVSAREWALCQLTLCFELQSKNKSKTKGIKWVKIMLTVENNENVAVTHLAIVIAILNND